MKIEIDTDKLAKLIEEKAKMPEDVMGNIVEKVANKVSNDIESKIPVDEGITKSFWKPSSVRVYPDQAWETVSFIPKKFGDVGSKGKGWKQRTESNSGWGWGYISSFDPRNHKSFGWFAQEMRKGKTKAKRLLKKEVENYYK